MSADDPRNDDSPWTRPTIVGSGVFILLLIIAGIVILLLPGSHHHHRQIAQAPTTTATATTSAPQGTISSPTKGPCSLPPGPQAIPSAAPPKGTTWQTVDAMVVPQAPKTYGPQHVKNGFNVCFAHSPAGALLADFNVQAAATSHLPADVYAHLTVGAPRHITDKTELGNGHGDVQIAGYKYDSYSSGEASITVVVQFPGNVDEASITSMRWVGDDWKLVYPDGGTFPTSQISSLAGYVKWRDL